MQNVDRKLQKVSKRLKNVGAGLSVGVTLPLVALGAASIEAFDKQAKAIAQVEAGLKSTGNQVGRTSQQLQDAASDLQDNSLFGDEEILKGVTAQLLTFTNIAQEQFDRTQLAALDLSTRLDGDLKSSSIQLGKALNDPVANLSALSRSGIQFSESQKSTINALVKTNRLADAQTIILDELEKQYGGSAEAAAKAGKGPLQQLGNILGDITEDFGAIILEGIKPFVASLKDIAIRFRNLSPATKKWIVIIGGVAAAIGPLLALAGTILPAILTGFALLTGPIGLIVAGLTAVGVVIYKNWSPIKKTLLDIANYFVDLYNESTVFRISVEAVILVFKNLFEVGKFVFETLKNIVSNFIDNFTSGFKTVGKIIKAVFTGSLEDIPKILEASSKESLSNFKGFTSELATDWKALTTGIENDANQALDNITSRKKLEYFKENVDTTGITDAVADATVKGIQQGSATAGNFSGVGSGTSFNTQIELDDIDSKIAELDQIDGLLASTGDNFRKAVEQADVSVLLGSMSNAFEGFIQETEDNLIVPFTEKMERLKVIGEAVGDSVAGAFQNLSGRIVDSLGLANDGFQGFIKGLVQTVTKLISIMLAQSISQSIAGATASGAATGPAAVFSTPGFIATAVSGVIAAFAAIPKFNTGGIVGGSSLYGDKILARVNSGELILNQKQQRRLFSMIQPASVGGETIVLKSINTIKGSDIITITEREQKKQGRIS